jgi:hypothetical protein
VLLLLGPRLQGLLWLAQRVLLELLLQAKLLKLRQCLQEDAGAAAAVAAAALVIQMCWAHQMAAAAAAAAVKAQG